MSAPAKVDKKILIVSIAFIVLGTVLIFYSGVRKRSGTCKNILDRLIDKRQVVIDEIYLGKRYAIYLVNTVSTCCRPLLKIDRFVADQSTNIEIYVADDFSANDIENFKYAFELPAEIPVKKKNPGNKWLEIIANCNYRDRDDNNVLILLNKDSKIEEITGF